MNKIGLGILIVALPLIVISCGTVAKITKKDGSIVEGTITNGDDKSVYLETFGTKVAVDKASIADIDHPGNGAAVTGAALTAYGVLNIAVGVSDCSEYGAVYCVGVFSPAIVGVGLMLYGFPVWSTSNANVNKPPAASMYNTYVVPVYAMGHGANYYGVAFAREF